MEFAKVKCEQEISSDSDSSHSLDENLSASNFNLSLDNVIGINGAVGTPALEKKEVKSSFNTSKAKASASIKEEESGEDPFGNEESNSVAEFNYEIDPSSILLQSHSPDPENAPYTSTHSVNNSDHETHFFQEETFPDRGHRKPKRKKRFRKSSLALGVLTKLKVEQSSYRKALLFYLLKKHLTK